MEPAKRNSIFELHPNQEVAFDNIGNKKYPIICCISGIQGGKTTIGALASRQAYSIWGPANYIVGGPTHPIMNQATIPTFRKWWTPYTGDYKVQEKRHVIRDGGNVWFRSGTDPDSFEGIPDAVFGVLDEGGKCKYDFYINMMARLARRGGQLMITTTPYTLNWLWRDVVRPAMHGERDDVLLITWRSVDNPSFPMEEYEKQKTLMDPKSFRRKYDGAFERPEGLVFELTDNIVVKPINIPRARYFAGVDWGYEHPFAIVIRAIMPDGTRYDVSTFKKSHMDPNEKIAVMKSKLSVYPIELTYADPEDPAMIAAFNAAGIRTVPFHIGKENYKKVIPGIELHTMLMRSGHYHVFNTLKDLIDEYEGYHWPEDSLEKAENPVPVDDDLMCAMRYVSVGTSHIALPQIKAKEIPPHLLYDDFDPRRKPRKKSWASS